jgi:hypothetical protein
VVDPLRGGEGVGNDAPPHQTGHEIRREGGCPLELIDKREILEKLLAYQKQVTEENIDFISLNGRTSDNGLLKTEEPNSTPRRSIIRASTKRRR